GRGGGRSPPPSQVARAKPALELGSGRRAPAIMGVGGRLRPPFRGSQRRPPPQPPPPPPPPRRWPPPPPPAPPPGLATSTLIRRPSSSVLFRRATASLASSVVAISTNPKPRDRPVSRSVTTLADSTVPIWAKVSRRRSLEVENERLPTKSLTAMTELLPAFRTEHGQNSEEAPDAARRSRGFTMNRPCLRHSECTPKRRAPGGGFTGARPGSRRGRRTASCRRRGCPDRP